MFKKTILVSMFLSISYLYSFDIIDDHIVKVNDFTYYLSKDKDECIYLREDKRNLFYSEYKDNLIRLDDKVIVWGNGDTYSRYIKKFDGDNLKLNFFSSETMCNTFRRFIF